MLLVGGLLLGWLAALLSRTVARRGARRRRTMVAGRLREAIAAVATDQLVEPVREVLARHRETRLALEAAARV